VIDVRAFQGLAVTASATYTRGISCSVILYSGDDSRAVTVWPESSNMAEGDLAWFYEGQSVSQTALAAFGAMMASFGEWR
jgi:hypothetical protein